MHLIYNEVFDAMGKHATIQKHPEETEEILEIAFDHLKECDKPEFEKLLLQLHKLVYDGKFSEMAAKHAVKHMKNADPKHPQGEFWSEHKVAEIAKKYGITEFNTDPWGVYYVLNMMRSDYFNAALDECDEDYYAVLAKDFIQDRDAAENKIFCYWYHIAKGF